MKKILSSTLIITALISLYSCKVDNYELPAETIRGRVVDAATGALVLTDQGSEGTRVRLNEVSWTGTRVASNFDFFAMKAVYMRSARA